jgi:hypothetical protein
MKYTRPGIGENTIAYKGRKYCGIKLAQDGTFDLLQKSWAIGTFLPISQFIFQPCGYNHGKNNVS